MPEPDCFFRCRIGAATQNFTSGKSKIYVLGTAVKRGFMMVLYTYLFMIIFTELSKHLCRRYMRSTEWPSSFERISQCKKKLARLLFRLTLALSAQWVMIVNIGYEHHSLFTTVDMRRRVWFTTAKVEQKAVLIRAHILYLKPEHLPRDVWGRIWMRQQNQW